MRFPLSRIQLFMVLSFSRRVVILEGPGCAFVSETLSILAGISSASYSVFISGFFSLGLSPEALSFSVSGSRASFCGSVFIWVLTSFFFVTFARFDGECFSLEKFFGHISLFKHSLHLGFLIKPLFYTRPGQEVWSKKKGNSPVRDISVGQNQPAFY